MGTLWTGTAEPSKTLGIASYNDSFSTCVDTAGQIQDLPVLVP